jgi:hypothetical protein
MMNEPETCSSTKSHYPTFALAQKRLFEICAKPEKGRTHHPNRVICCDECRQYVLTSRLRSKTTNEGRGGRRRRK